MPSLIEVTWNYTYSPIKYLTVQACHSFGREKNAMFHEFEHPRFGSIMSVVAVKPIYKGNLYQRSLKVVN